MGQAKQQWIDETGGFRIGESPEVTSTRRRVQELARKLKSEGLNDDERAEYRRLVDSLPDNDD